VTKAKTRIDTLANVIDVNVALRNRTRRYITFQFEKITSLEINVQLSHYRNRQRINGPNKRFPLKHAFVQQRAQIACTHYALKCSTSACWATMNERRVHLRAAR